MIEFVLYAAKQLKKAKAHRKKRARTRLVQSQQKKVVEFSVKFS